MITTLKTTLRAATSTASSEAQDQANIVTLPVVRAVKTLGQTKPQHVTNARHANHNLTQDARRSNVVLLSHFQTTDDFPPDLGARPLCAA